MKISPASKTTQCGINSLPKRLAEMETGMTNEQSQSFAHTVGVNAGVSIKDIFEIGAS
ncbi:hypothetical protein ABEX66_08755 [Bacillus rhizoplanae]